MYPLREENIMKAVLFLFAVLLSGNAMAADEPCPLADAIKKYGQHVITVKVKIGTDVDEKLGAVITRNGKCIKVDKPDKDGNIALRVTAEELKTLRIVNKDGEQIDPSAVSSKETAPQRTENVVTGRSTVVVNGRVVRDDVTRANVTYKARAEVTLDVTRRDANSAKKP